MKIPASKKAARQPAQRQAAAAEAQWRQGLACAQAGDWPAAKAGFERAVALDPGNPAAFKLHTMCLADQHRWEDAIRAFESYPAQAPRDHEFHASYGNALYETGKLREAVDQFIASFCCKPDHVQAHVSLAMALARMDLHEEAAEALRTAVVLNPTDVRSLGFVVYHSRYACRWDRLADDRRQLDEALTRLDCGSTSPFPYLSMSGDPELQRVCAQTHARAEFGRIAALAPVAQVRPADGGRLRIGYLSNDFHNHATTILMAELLEHHDRDRFDVRLYSHSHDDGSPMRRRVIAAADEFVEIGEMTDLEAAQRIRADGIDVLVDLKGFTRGNRLGIFARRPAPLQVSYLGYPGTTGACFLDYVVGDRFVTPVSAARFYSEKIAQLPNSYQPNDRKRPTPAATPRSDCGLPDDAFVFCCFNANYKISPNVFARWCAILRAVPGSVLWLYEANAQAARNLRREAQAAGVAPDRLVFAAPLDPATHLARVPNADLFLDTLPYNAHTTASDALWMGVPLVTCIGEAFAGRVAASLLNAVGMPELVTETLDDYERLAVSLAGDRGRLAALRERLLAVRHEAPLFDSQRYARDLESLYDRMAARSRAGLAPEHLPA